MSDPTSLFPSPLRDPSLIMTNPHNTTSIRSLTALKIVDRLSCYAVGFTQAEATKTRLASMFAQFGEVTSIRIIQNRKPFEVYMRFSTEAAALRAIAWCNESTAQDMRTRLSANHGYNKYCIKFINNKQCRKENCPNQHKWVSPSDIIERPKQKPPHSQQPQPQPQHQTQADDEFEVQAQAQAQQAQRDRAKWLRMTDLQQNFSALQARFSQQNAMVQVLLRQVNQLKLQNEALRNENQSMSAGRPSSSIMSSTMSSSGKENVPKRMSPQHHSEAFVGGDADMAMGELVDFVISHNAPIASAPTMPTMPTMSTPTAVAQKHSQHYNQHHNHLARANANYGYGAYATSTRVQAQAQAQAHAQMHAQMQMHGHGAYYRYQ